MVGQKNEMIITIIIMYPFSLSHLSLFSRHKISFTRIRFVLIVSLFFLLYTHTEARKNDIPGHTYPFCLYIFGFKIVCVCVCVCLHHRCLCVMALTKEIKSCPLSYKHLYTKFEFKYKECHPWCVCVSC